MSSTAISNSGLNNDNIAINRSRENVVQQIQHIDTFTDGVLQHLSATNISVEEEGDMPTRSSDIQGASAPDHPAPTVSPMSTVSSSPRHLPNGLTSQLMPIRKPVPKTVPSYQETMLSKAGLPWRPVYLRRRVLLAFAVIFTIIVVAIEALAYVSTMNQGLVAGQYRLQYLWKYGPTAILSVVMALWGRVEYQSKSTAPWYRLWSGPQGASRSVLLDYISPILPVAVYQAIKHKDYIVASTIIISLLLRAIVIFSTSFISLVPTQVIVSSVPVTLGNTFKDVADTWSSPWGQEIGSFTAQLYNSLSAGQTKYPTGLQNSFAYQDFSVDMAPFHDVTMATDAFSGNLKCHESNYINISIHDTIRSSESRPQAYDVGNCTVEFDVTFPQNISDPVIYGRSELSLCDENYHKYPGGSSAPPLYESNLTLQVYFMKVSYVNRTTKGRNDTYQSGVIDMWLEKTCTPSHMLRKIAVTRAEGESDQFVTIDQPPRALPETKPWSSLLDLNDMFNRGTDGMITNTTWVQTPDGSPLAINLDGLLSHAIDKQTMTNSPDIVESIFGSSMVEDKFNDVFKSYASFLGFMYFQQPTSGLQSNASATTTQNRLLVTVGTAHTMAGLSGLCLLLLAAMIGTIPKYGILPRNPTTIIGMAALISPSKRFTSSLEDMGSMSEKNIRSRLGSAEYRAYTSSHENSCTGRSFYLNTLQSADDNISSTTEKGDNQMRYPIVLHPVYRIVACLCVVGIVVTLESLLRKSTSNDGLSDLIKADDTPYGWTLLPAVVLSLVSIYYGAIESQIRLLSPYNNLLRGSKFDLTLALDLTDRLAITSLIASAKLRLYATIVSIATSFVAFFLTIAASSLFTPVEVSNVVNTTQLPALDTFNYATFWDAHGSGGSRILGANIEYSPFTYADLVLPHLQLRGQLFDEAANITLDNIYTTAMVPAARSYLSCKTFESSELQATFTPVYDPVNGSPLEVIIGNDNGTNLTIQVYELDSWVANSFYFGVATPGSQDWRGTPDVILAEGQSYSEYLYVWGQVPDKTKTDVSSVFAMACNESAQEVNVKATFFGPNMDIRPEHPPQPDENTAHVVSQFPLCPSDDDPWDFDQVNCKSPGSLYEDLEHIDSPHVLDKFFSTLTSRAGRLAIDVAYLGNESEAQSVADAVIQQHKILRAHAFGTTGRLWYNATDGPQADSITSTPGTISVQANITNTTARIRLVQDAVSTRVLEGLLTSILILSLLSWYTMPSTKLLPRDPCSITSVVSLLADGDILDLLPPNAQQMTDKELEKLFSRGTFHMQMDERGRLGIRYKDA